MKAAFIRGAFAFAAIVALASASFAASTVKVQVVENELPQESVSVQVLASDGTFSDITDVNGEIALDIAGKYFRLVVNGQVVDGGFEATGQTVVVDLASQ
jgi:hypothetical protein